MAFHSRQVYLLAGRHASHASRGYAYRYGVRQYVRRVHSFTARPRGAWIIVPLAAPAAGRGVVVVVAAPPRRPVPAHICKH